VPALLSTLLALAAQQQPGEDEAVVEVIGGNMLERERRPEATD
jgi:hypothetical protein